MKAPNKKLDKLKGYIRFFGRYVSHGRVLALLAAGLAAGAVYIELLHPSAVRLYMSIIPVPEIIINSIYMEGYSGRARLVQENGSLIYEGWLTEGRVEGKGRLYSRGALVYEGEFVNNMYNGQGHLYDGGKLLYEGVFAQNVYSGQGKLYNSDGKPVYEGGFLNGEKSGTGRVYDGESLLYAGEFSGGFYHGYGKLYDIPTESLLYEGSFQNGVFDGSGTLYSDNGLIYEGGFSEGLYCGEGTLFGDGDRVIYKGQWLAGLYDGNGKLYERGALLYDGEFSGGVYNGEGREYYPDTGYPKYEGFFLDGRYMDSGTFYDEKGRPIETKPTLSPEQLLDLTYGETIELLKDAQADYEEMELGGAPLILIADISRIISFSTDPKSDGTPGRVKYVYLCGLDAESGILTAMTMAQIVKELGDPEDGKEILPEAAEILALTISNDYWGRDVEAENTRGVSFNTEERRISVFYEITEDDLPGQALFLKVGVK